MTDPKVVHAVSTRILSGLMVVVGVAILVRTFSEGGTVLSLGLLLGVLFVLAGAGRIYVSIRREP